MEQIARVVERHEGVFILDEIYEHIIYEGEHVSMASFSFIYDRVITVNGVSKSFCNDRMENRIHGGAFVDIKSLQQAAGTVYLRSMFNCAEGCLCCP